MPAAALTRWPGSGKKLAQATGAFSEAYAAQNLDDYSRFVEAIESRRLPTTNAAG